MPTSARAAIDPASAQAIETLIARYAELVDDGDFTGVGSLLADATYRGGGGAPLIGREAIEKWFRDNLIVYPEGTPRTQHVTTNVVIDLDERAADAAVARSYVTVLQLFPANRRKSLPPAGTATGSCVVTGYGVSRNDMSTSGWSAGTCKIP
jgi:hypothetical protein